jgi:hypothetical protein
MSSTTEALFIAPPAFGKTRIIEAWRGRAKVGRLDRTRLFEAHPTASTPGNLVLRISGADAARLETELRDAALRLGISLRALIVEPGPIRRSELQRADQKHPPRAEPHIGRGRPA